MKAVLMNTSRDYNYNHRFGNPKSNFVTNRSLYSYRSDDLLLASFIARSRNHFGGGSLLSMPPPAGSVLGAPPLLPFPISMPPNHHNHNSNMNMNMNIYRSNSSSNSNSNNNSNSFFKLSPPRNNKNVKNRRRDHSLTPKKSKNQKKNSKKEEVDENRVTDQMIGPDPKDLPKDVIPRVFGSSINKSGIVSVEVDKFSGSVVFTPSPPPSSLPLPTFSLRPKLSCKAEARDGSTILGSSGVDDGATDSLRRLLRL